MRFNAILILTTSILMLVACDTKPRVKASNQDVMTGSKAQTAAHTIVVKEVLQANSYTYIYVSEGDAEYWIATAKQPLEVGMTLHYDKGMEMNDFTSKEIDRTFDSIFFEPSYNPPHERQNSRAFHQKLLKRKARGWRINSSPTSRHQVYLQH